MILVGIDPDLKGGIAVINALTRDIIRLDRMPVYNTPVTGALRLDAPGVYQCLKAARLAGAEYVVLEQALVKPQTSSKGPAMMGSVNKVHQNVGAIRALCELLFTRSRVIEAWPSVWKKAVGLTSEKALSLDVAVQLYPGHAPLLSKQKNVGIAEAILLVEYGATKLNLGAQNGLTNG